MSVKRRNIMLSCFMVALATVAPRFAQAAQIDRVVIAQGAFPVSFDPHRDVGIPSMSVNANVYDTLLVRNDAMQIGPGLAESYRQISPTVLELKLRKGVVFSNGEPFTADDAKYSIDRVLSKEQPSAQRGWISTIASADVIDPLTLRVTTSVADPVLPARLTLLFMVPKAYTMKVGAEGLAANPIGTGPYRITKWVRGDYVDLDYNDRYWGTAPEVKQARFRAIPDTAARIAALQAKNVHIITNLPPDYVAPIKRTEGLDVATVRSARVIFIAMVNTRPGPLQDQRVRQAINYAVDVNSIIKKLLLGNGIASGDVNGHLLRLLGINFKSELYGYDPIKAKKLLAEAGYPDGFSIDMDTPSGRYLMDRDIAQVVAAQLGEVGIKVNLKVHEWGAYSQLFTTHRTSPLYLFGWSLPSLDPDHWATPQLGLGEPLANFEDKDIQALITQGRQELNPAKRIQVYEKLNQVVHDKAPWLFLHQQIDLYGVNKSVAFTPRSDESIRIADIKLR